METELGDLIYKTGCISHESLFVQWYVKNGDTESHAQFLKNKGFLSAIEEVRYILSFSSSNIGNSKMSARLFCEWQGYLIPIGKPQSVWHLATKAVEDKQHLQEENGASIEDFRQKLRWLGASLKENEDCIEKMGNTILQHPKDCFSHILKQYCPTLPSKIKAEALEHVTFPTQTTAIDLYLEIVSLTEKLDMKQFHRLVQITEEIAQLQYINFQKFDREM